MRKKTRGINHDQRYKSKCVFFPMLNCKKRVKTAQSRSKNKLLLGFKKSWEGFPPSKILPNF